MPNNSRARFGSASQKFLLASMASWIAMSSYAAAQGGSDARTDQIVVTATKRETNLQETSIAITVISDETLKDRALYNSADLDRYVPNLLSSPSASATRNAANYNIRGIGQVDFITTTESGVGVYLDGVYLARAMGSAIDLADIERVEILRGPQGTLFGRNATGGAINIVSAQPNFDAFSGEASLTGGAITDGWRPFLNGRISLNVPLADDFAARFNFLAKVSDGFGSNTLAGRGEDLGEEETFAGRVSFLYRPSEDFDATLTAEASRGRGTISPMVGVVGPAAPGEDPNTAEMSASTADDMDSFGASLTLNYAINDDISLRSITAYREQEGRLGQDADGSSLMLIDQLVNFQQHQISQEIQLFGSAFEDRVDWLLGGYFFTEDGEFLSDVTLAFMPVTVDTFSSTHSYAAFGNLTVMLTEQLNLIGGFRYTSEKKTLDAETFFGGFPLVPRTILEKKFDSPSFKAGFEYFPHDSLMIYGTFSQGFRSGGFNGRPLGAVDLDPFDEEINNSYELGIKADLLDNSLRLNLAGFYSKYDDIQLTAVRSDPVVGIALVTANAGVAKLPGFEIEAQWAASENLDLYASVGYLDNDGVEPKEGFTLAGDTLPLSSEVNTVFGFDYSFPVGSFDGQLGFDWSYRSEYFMQIDDSPVVAEDGFHLFGARLKLAPTANDSWDVLFYAKNLADERYRAFGQDSISGLGVAMVTLAPGREVGVTLRARF